MEIQDVITALSAWQRVHDESTDAEERREAATEVIRLKREKDKIIAARMAISAPNQAYHDEQ